MDPDRRQASMASAASTRHCHVSPTAGGPKAAAEAITLHPCLLTKTPFPVLRTRSGERVGFGAALGYLLL
jgi:hypothetical protein